MTIQKAPDNITKRHWSIQFKLQNLFPSANSGPKDTNWLYRKNIQRKHFI